LENNLVYLREPISRSYLAGIHSGLQWTNSKKSAMKFLTPDEASIAAVQAEAAAYRWFASRGYDVPTLNLLVTV